MLGCRERSKELGEAVHQPLRYQLRPNSELEVLVEHVRYQH
jgi:hypothetical protein